MYTNVISLFASQLPFTYQRNATISLHLRSLSFICSSQGNKPSTKKLEFTWCGVVWCGVVGQEVERPIISALDFGISTLLTTDCLSKVSQVMLVPFSA